MKIQHLLRAALVLLVADRTSSAPTEGELFLTPLIKNGELDKARAQSEDNMKLSNIKSEKEIKSYSGYFTIDEKTNSNLFFWFFPAQESPDKAPVILWVNNVPGFSSLKGIFLETGPFQVDANKVVSERNTSWTRSHSMLYIDSPVGTGFSFSDSEEAYANSWSDEGVEIYEALKQYFTLFNEFQQNDFYLVGENNAATFIPSIVKRIEEGNVKSDLKIKVSGCIIGSPSLAIEQFHKAQALYDFGLIDLDQKKILDETIDKGLNLSRNGQAEEGTKIGFSTYFGPDSPLAKFTGFRDYYNALESNPPPEIEWFQNFIESKEVHNYLHVGVHKYFGVNFAVLTHFAKEFSSLKAETFEEMLNKGYRVLIYAPQFNILQPQKGITNVVNNLKWNGADKFSQAPRKIWKVNEDVAGYVKMSDNLAYAIVRNAGNSAIMNQPTWMLDLVEKFIYKREI